MFTARYLSLAMAEVQMPLSLDVSVKLSSRSSICRVMGSFMPDQLNLSYAARLFMIILRLSARWADHHDKSAAYRENRLLTVASELSKLLRELPASVFLACCDSRGGCRNASRTRRLFLPESPSKASLLLPHTQDILCSDLTTRGDGLSRVESIFPPPHLL